MAGWRERTKKLQEVFSKAIAYTQEGGRRSPWLTEASFLTIPAGTLAAAELLRGGDPAGAFSVMCGSAAARMWIDMELGRRGQEALARQERIQEAQRYLDIESQPGELSPEIQDTRELVLVREGWLPGGDFYSRVTAIDGHGEERLVGFRPFGDRDRHLMAIRRIMSNSKHDVKFTFVDKATIEDQILPQRTLHQDRENLIFSGKNAS